MENEEENIVPDSRAITIHCFSWGFLPPDMFPIYDTKISIYCLPKNSRKEYYESDGSANGSSIKEGGYIIEAQIKIVRNSKIKFITKEYFDEIYKEFKSLNFKALEKENPRDCDGWQLEVKMGMVKYNKYDPLKYTGKTRNTSLWSPLEDRKKPETLKLLKLTKAIEAKIEYDKWYKYNFEEWLKCYDTISRCMIMFRVGIEKDIKCNSDHNW